MTIPIPTPPKESALWHPGRVFVRARPRRPWEYVGRHSDFVWQVWVHTPHQLHTGGEWRCTLETGTAWDARRRADRIVKLAQQVYSAATSWPDALAWAAGLLNDDPAARLRAQLARGIRESVLRPNAVGGDSHIGLFQQPRPAAFGRSSAGIWD
ncbi:hypothetical protein J1770_gp79 [Gordonia phage EMoore]|uniref:Uncharacterized protein n=1 Tax=Gordonia phage EMoore TaxID=2656534 RepID=A0A649VUJ3_9CAUD|nr:hypothetical protein J1770_gp79 [Gordonia phage EMoore]QGJ95864.1 hypothetical protein SEA_EMOORE_79 [Gordonia phage EMoore]